MTATLLIHQGGDVLNGLRQVKKAFEHEQSVRIYNILYMRKVSPERLLSIIPCHAE